MWISARLTGNHTCCYEKVKIANISDTCFPTWKNPNRPNSYIGVFCAMIHAAFYICHYSVLHVCTQCVTRPERDSGERKRNKSEQELYFVIWMEIQSSYLSIHVRRSCCDRNRFQFICTNTKMTTKTTMATFKKRIKFNSVNMETWATNR